jgi:protein KTI12
MIRGKIKFEVEKNLTGNTIVICDSLNYIKGYRYQMFCIAREQKTTYCLVFSNSSLETAKIYNSKNESKFS